MIWAHLSVKYTGLSLWYYRWQKPEVVRPAVFWQIVIDSRGCPLSSLDLNTDLSEDVWKVCICINQSNIRLMEHLRSAVDQLVILVYRIGIWCEYHAMDCLGRWILNCGGGPVSSWELFTIGWGIVWELNIKLRRWSDGLRGMLYPCGVFYGRWVLNYGGALVGSWGGPKRSWPIESETYL